MRATGIVRRLDELGRIVIPKEIRRNLNLREGDALEMYVDGESLVLKPYITEPLSYDRIADKYKAMPKDARVQLIQKMLSDIDTMEE